MTTTNFAEVATRYVLPSAATEATRLRELLPVSLVPIDEDLALRAALMAEYTRQAGLGLGDRLCLAHAMRRGVPVLTADTAWLDVADALGSQIELVR